jgi:acyl-ACP thioesterase
LRATDVDMHGHVNNSIHWQAVEHALVSGGVDAAGPLAAELDYREPLDAGEQIELLTERREDGLRVALRTPAAVKAVATVVLG